MVKFIRCFISEGQRLQVSSLTIKLAASEDKDGPSFTGTYPSTVLAEQEVTLDTHIMVRSLNLKFSTSS